MIHLAILAALLTQEEPLDSVIRKLDSENVQERDRAAAELRRRGEAAMDTLQKAERKAAEPSEKARLRRALEEVLGYRPLTVNRVRALRITCSLGPTKVRAAAAELARLSGLPVEVDAPAGFDPAVSELAGNDAPLEGLLDSLARQAGGMWLVDGRRILVFVSGKVPLRLFDVRDLTNGIEDERWIHLEPDESDTATETPGGTSYVYTGEDLANLVKNEVSPKSWEEADGKSIQFQNGLLIVRNDAEVLRGVEAQLEACRRTGLLELKVEIEAYAVKPGTKVEETSIERLREEAAEGRTARRVSWFERTTHDKRRIALCSQTRLVLLTGHDAGGTPITSPFSTGSRGNLRASLDHERSIVRVDLEAGWSRLLSLEKKKEAAGEVLIPTFASHTLRLTVGVSTGRFVVLGRIGETKIVDGLGDIVVVGRFTPVERP
jgi:hypothetical protein